MTGLFQSGPRAHDQTIEAFFGQVRDDELWVHKPKIYSQAETFLKRHYDALNPLELHTFVPTPMVAPFQLVVERAALAPNKFVITYGRVIASRVMEPTKEPYRSFMLQLIPATAHFPPRLTDEDPVIYCRVPLEEVIIPAGELILAEGVVVASGTAESSRGGIRPAVYMDCAAIAPPKGVCGHFPLPPLEGAFEHCGRGVLRRYQEEAVRANVYPHEAGETPYIEQAL